MYNELLIQQSNELTTNKRTYYIIDDYLFYFWDTPEERLQYKKKNDIFWIWCSSEEFYHMITTKLIYHHTVRYYGEPKLSKPKELKGIKQNFSVEYIPKKCSCKVFIKYPDIWIQHKDYFSPSLEVDIEDQDKPLGYLAEKYLDKTRKIKFVYDDAWGDIVLRNEAWIRIQNLLPLMKYKSQSEILQEILRQQEKINNFKPYDLYSSDMERMFEKILNNLTIYKTML